MAIDRRDGQVSRLLDYLPAIFWEQPKDSSGPLPLGRFLMAFESILLGLPKSKPAEWADLRDDPGHPGIEEILGGAVQQGAPASSEELLRGIERYFDPGPGYKSRRARLKIPNYNRAPEEFLAWLAGWVALSLRDDWTEEHQRKFIAHAVRLYNLRGTKKGVLDFVGIYDEKLKVDITESDDHTFTVTVDDKTTQVSPHQLELLKALIEIQKPAHTSFNFQLKSDIIE